MEGEEGNEGNEGKEWTENGHDCDAGTGGALEGKEWKVRKEEWRERRRKSLDLLEFV